MPLSRRAARLAVLLSILLAACDPLDTTIPTQTPTPGMTGPTIAPSPQLFQGPPTEGPPPANGALGISDPTAAALPASGALPPRALSSPAAARQPQPIEVVTYDGALLTGNLYQTSTARQPGLLLLGPSQADWGDFPAQLSAAGYTVLVMSVRENGDERDVQAIMDALISGMADPARIAAVGAAQGADLVLRGCAISPVCDTVVLLSPQDEAALLSALARFNPRPLMLVASEEDAGSYQTAQALEAAASGDTLFQPFASAGQGAAMLINRPDLGGLIIEWMRRQMALE